MIEIDIDSQVDILAIGRLRLHGPKFKFGKDPLCDVVLNDDDISALHLEIVFDDSNYVLIPKNNSLLYINNKKVTAPKQINEEDSVKLGKSSFKILQINLNDILLKKFNSQFINGNKEKEIIEAIEGVLNENK